MDIKPIETRYKGYKFRSRLEAKWAVFFDACGIDWDYEPEGFCIDGEINYLPDFLLHDVFVQAVGVIDLYVEIKGIMTDVDAFKIKSFAYGKKFEKGIYEIKNPILILGNIPKGETFDEKIKYMDNCLFNSFNSIHLFSHELINNYGVRLALPALDCNWEFRIFDLHIDDWIDEEKTNLAYKKAQQARFEHGESPE